MCEAKKKVLRAHGGRERGGGVGVVFTLAAKRPGIVLVIDTSQCGDVCLCRRLLPSMCVSGSRA